ncbi:serine/arginine repetitive matrix protein 1-like, partial [Uloborus diversus]|uniref:serine/arginine repetitive matrix protein 1-like n=1 Tax=Uloborus diversus TaxID=327109 RepID=UPI00240A1ADA
MGWSARVVDLEADKKDKDNRLKILEVENSALQNENKEIKKDMKEMKRRNTVLEKKVKEADKTIESLKALWTSKFGAIPDADGGGNQSPVPSNAPSPAQLPPVASPVASPANPQDSAQAQGQSPRRSPRSRQAPSRLSYDSSDSSAKKKRKSPSKKFWNQYKKLIAKGEKVSAQCIKTGNELGAETEKAKRYYNAKVRRAHSISSSGSSSSSSPSTSRRPPTSSPRQTPSPKSPRSTSSPKSTRRASPKDPGRRKKPSSASSSFQNFSSYQASPINDAVSAQSSPPQVPIASPAQSSFLLPGAARAVPGTGPRWSSVQRRLSFSNTDAAAA